MDYAAIRGFNYQPSYGSTGYELWHSFDAAVVKEELARGKTHFPGMNAIRLWLSWEAFVRDPAGFSRNFETALALAAELDLAVMPVLFNRWHAWYLDYGGIYIDHFYPEVRQLEGRSVFAPYLETIVGNHADDARILAWDLCNEPQFGSPCDEVNQAEFGWLEGLYGSCKDLGASAPITVGIAMFHSAEGVRHIEPISDLLSIHPYWFGEGFKPPAGRTFPAAFTERAAFEAVLDACLAVAHEAGKPLLATETCWGALDDAARVAIIRYTLGELVKRRVGFLAYLLHHSLIADAHRPEYGPVGHPGNLAFIEADGSLRPGHAVFNEF